MTIYINGTSGISGVDGSAGTPAIQGTDVNTGVLFPAADTWAVAVGGVEKMRVQSSGMSGCIASGTAVASTSGTSIDFTGIPSWVKRITVMFDGVSTSGTSPTVLQIGDSGGIETSGYNGATRTAATDTIFSSSFQIDATGQGNAAILRYGVLLLCLLDSSTNLWACNGVLGASNSGSPFLIQLGGTKALSATLDRIRITTVNGTDTFDAGTINILWEG